MKKDNSLIKFKEFSKSVSIIKKLELIDDKNKRCYYTQRELKLFNYFFSELQKKQVYTKTKEVKFVTDLMTYNELTGNWYIKDSLKENETIDFILNQKDLKNILNFNKYNYIKEIENVVSSLGQKTLKITRPYQRTYYFLFNKIDFDKNKDTGIYTCKVNININFLAEILTMNDQQFAKIDITKIKNLKSKYSIRLYEEFERILQTSHGHTFKKSIENIKEFFGTKETRQDNLHRYILKSLKELEDNNLFTCDYKKYKNDENIWIYSITNINRIKNDIQIVDEQFEEPF